jgi:hypothetical protein
VDITVIDFRITGISIISITCTDSVLTFSHTVTFAIRIAIFIFGITIVDLGTSKKWVFTFISRVHVSEVEVRESPRFIIRTLIDGRVHIDVSFRVRVNESNINLIEVIRPGISTLITNIGVRPLR